MVQEEKSQKKRAGFSLMELMVVVLILGLLGSLVITNIFSQAERAKQSIACTQMKTFQQALDLFKQDHGAYPTTEEGLEALIKNPDAEKYSGYMSGGYLSDKTVPKDPWKRVYVYLSDDNGIDILSLGADGKEGGTEENEDIRLSTCSAK